MREEILKRITQDPVSSRLWEAPSHGATQRMMNTMFATVHYDTQG